MSPHKGIPTVYNGIQYRSRLEARWACMFDQLGWQFEYEPFDLSGWIPDFLLIGKTQNVLVEVKPVTSFPKDVAAKIEAAGPGHECLIVGCVVPVPSEDHPFMIGWLGGYDSNYYPPKEDEFALDWEEAMLGRWSEGHDATRGPVGFCHSTGSYHDRISGVYECGNRRCFSLDNVWRERVREMWKIAGNKTQWKGAQSTHQQPRLVRSLDPLSTAEDNRSNADRLFDELTGEKPNHPLDAEHKKLINWLSEQAAPISWSQDHDILMTHTYWLKEAHKTLGLKGTFETISTGRPKSTDQNCFMYPLRNGVWVVRRFGLNLPEASTWHRDSRGYTRCFLNPGPDLERSLVGV